MTASSPKLGVRACHAAPGDVWAYSTPILHASAPSQSVDHRRVLQLDFASGELPRGSTGSASERATMLEMQKGGPLARTALDRIEVQPKP